MFRLQATMIRASAIALGFAIIGPATAFADTHPMPQGEKLPNGRCKFNTTNCAGKGVHNGTDLFAPVGTIVKSMCPGKVKYNNTAITAKRTIWHTFLVIEHQCKNGNYVGYYGHIDSNIRVGQSVSEGQNIGKLRDWGNNTHLHMSLSPTLYTSGWGYTSTIKDFVDFELILADAQKKITPQIRKPNAPRLRTTQQKTSNVGLFWDKNPNGSNYRVQVAPVNNRWSAEDGFSDPIVNSTKVAPAGSRYMGYAWRNAPSGTYQYTVRVNIEGVGYSKFAIPKTFTVK